MTGELDEKKTQIKILQQTLQVAYTLIMYIYNIFMSTYLRAGIFTLQDRRKCQFYFWGNF